MSIPDERDVNAGAPALWTFLLGYTGAVWERLKSISGALLVAYANASSLAFGSVATGATAAALGGVTTYTGGIIVSNLDTAITIWIGSTSGVTAAVGAGNYPLAPGKDLVLPTGSLADIFAIAASGTPTIGWIGVTA